MKFFEKSRVEFCFNGGKLCCNGKTGVRSWRMNLVITLKAAEVISCDEMIMRNYEALETRENCIEEIKIAKEVPDHVIKFFALGDHKAPVLTLGRCTMTELKMTRVDGCSELWVKVEHENTEKLHAFVKDYAFTRLWAEFAPVQPSLTEVPQTKKPVPKEPGPRLM